MPLVYPQSLWFAGIAFCVLVVVLLFLRSLHEFLQGNLDQIFRLIGSKSAVAEAEEEVKSVEHAMEEGRK
jgi:hypothetical protein